MFGAGRLTVTSQVALLLSAVAVMMASPELTAVTSPSSETVATASLLVVQVTSEFAASEGVTVASSWAVSPGIRVSWLVWIVTDSTVITGLASSVHDAQQNAVNAAASR